MMVNNPRPAAYLEILSSSSMLTGSIVVLMPVIRFGYLSLRAVSPFIVLFTLLNASLTFLIRSWVSPTASNAHTITRSIPFFSNSLRIISVFSRTLSVKKPFVVTATDRSLFRLISLSLLIPEKRLSISSSRKGSPPVISSSLTSDIKSAESSSSQSFVDSSGSFPGIFQILHIIHLAIQLCVTSRLRAWGLPGFPVLFRYL